MSQHADQAKAQALIDEAFRESHAYIARNGLTGDTTVARQGFEIGMLHAHIRTLCTVLAVREEQLAKEKRAKQAAWEELGEAGLMDYESDDSAADMAAFTRATGAADVLPRRAA